APVPEESAPPSAVTPVAPAALPRGVAANRELHFPLVQKAARSSGIPADFLDRKILMESGYNPRAQNRNGACGILQIMPETLLEVMHRHAADHGRPDLADLVTRRTNSRGNFVYSRTPQKTKAAARAADAKITAACRDPELTLLMGADYMRDFM